MSSIFTTRPGLPAPPPLLTDISAAGAGLMSLLPYMSWNQNTKSSAVKGEPSDHLMPRRRNRVVRRPSALTSQPLATLGRSSVPVASKKISLSPERSRLPFSLSPGPMKPRRQVPPYWPVLRTGFSTSGSDGRRWATGGSAPDWTWAASIGASWKVRGISAGSVTMVGPSSFPTRPDWSKALLVGAAVWANAVWLIAVWVIARPGASSPATIRRCRMRFPSRAASVARLSPA